MKISKDFFLICENLIIDNEKRLTIINSFNAIYGGGVPLIGPKIVIAYVFTVKLDSKKQKLNYKISLKSPLGEEFIKDGIGEINRQDILKEQGVGGAFTINNPVFPEFGIYKLSMDINGKLVASRELTISRRQPDVTK